MRRLTVVLALLLLPIVSVAAIHSPALASTGHGCASPVPPGVTGAVSMPAAPDVVMFNEILTSPHSTWNCSESSAYFGPYDSWIEFYNTQNQSYNLYAAHATIDTGPNTNSYIFPLGASIPAHGYLVIFPDLRGLTMPGNTPFTLRLIESNVVIDQATVPVLGFDQSYARMPDGGSSWQVSSQPTIDASNTSLITPTAGAAPGSSATVQAVAFGTQPAWNKMQPTPTPTQQLTLAASPSPAATFSAPSNSPAPTPTSGLDLPRRVILTLLIIALSGVLLWWWRSSRASKEKS